MSLRKPFTLTPARLEANRRNARKSTGPRTAQGKAQSRLNGLHEGTRSPLYRRFLLAMLNAPPGAVERTARAVLTPEQAAHPLIADCLELFRKVEIDTAEYFGRRYS
jgi:hypothetical protein